jgi:outer membrane autotransporter protein
VVSVTNDGASLFNQTATGHWGGWGLTSRFRVSYEARWNAIYVRPQLGLDYFRLSEDAYNEGGGAAIDLAVNQRTTSEFSGFAGVAVGAAFGQEGATWGPELLLGYRDVVDHSDGLTTARFLTGGDPFTVGENPVGDGGAVVRAAFKSESTWGAVSLEGGAEIRDNLTVYDAKLAVHFKF